MAEDPFISALIGTADTAGEASAPATDPFISALAGESSNAAPAADPFISALTGNEQEKAQTPGESDLGSLIGAFTGGVKQGVASEAAAVPGLIGLLAEAVGAKETGQALIGTASDITKAAAETSEVPDTLGEKALSAIGQAIPFMVGTLASGGVLGFAAKGALRHAIKKGIAQKALERAAVKGTLKEIPKRAAVGGGLSNVFAVESTATATESRDAGLPDNPYAALTAGAAKTALEAITPLTIAGRFGLGPKVTRELADKITEKFATLGVPQRILLGSLGVGSSEAVTEAAQEAVDLAVRDFRDENFDILGPEGIQRLEDSAFGGGVVGALLGPLGFATVRRGVGAGTPLDVRDIANLNRPVLSDAQIDSMQLSNQEKERLKQISRDFSILEQKALTGDVEAKKGMGELFKEFLDLRRKASPEGIISRPVAETLEPQTPIGVEIAATPVEVNVPEVQQHDAAEVVSKVFNAPLRADHMSPSPDFSNLRAERIAPNAGVNAGLIVKDESSGVRYFVKSARTYAGAINEALAARLYRLISPDLAPDNIAVPINDPTLPQDIKDHIVNRGGNGVLISREVPNFMTLQDAVRQGILRTRDDIVNVPGFIEGLGLDMLLKLNDTHALNVGVVDTGNGLRAVRVDLGWSLASDPYGKVSADQLTRNILSGYVASFEQYTRNVGLSQNDLLEAVERALSIPFDAYDFIIRGHFQGVIPDSEIENIVSRLKIRYNAMELLRDALYRTILEPEVVDLTDLTHAMKVSALAKGKPEMLKMSLGLHDPEMVDAAARQQNLQNYADRLRQKGKAGDLSEVEYHFETGNLKDAWEAWRIAGLDKEFVNYWNERRMLMPDTPRLPHFYIAESEATRNGEFIVGTWDPEQIQDDRGFLVVAKPGDAVVMTNGKILARKDEAFLLGTVRKRDKIDIPILSFDRQTGAVKVEVSPGAVPQKNIPTVEPLTPDTLSPNVGGGEQLNLFPEPNLAVAQPIKGNVVKQGVATTPDVGPQQLELALKEYNGLDDVYDGAGPGGVDPHLESRVSAAKALFDAVEANSRDLYRGVDKWGWYVKKLWNLPQIVFANAHVPGLTRYLDAATDFNNTYMKWVSLADARAKEMLSLGRQQYKALNDFIFRIGEGEYLGINEEPRAPTSEELARIAKETGISKEAFDLWLKMNHDFAAFLAEMERLATTEAQVQLADTPELLDKKLTEIREEFDRLRQRPYVPFSRFGDYTVVVEAKGPESGKWIPIEVTAYESQAARDEAFFEIQAKRKGDSNVRVRKDKFDRSLMGLRGVPRTFLDVVANKLNLSEEQRRQLALLKAEVSPARSFARRLIRRKETPGFERDILRAYADYFFYGSSYIAKITHDRDFRQALDLLKKNISERAKEGLDVTKRVEMLEYLTEHQQYLYNPGNEWSHVRAAMFIWYLGFNPKSAAVNLTQVPLVAYPYLAARTSDAAAISSLTRAIKGVRKLYSSKRAGLSPEDESAVRAVDLAVQMGFIDESQATELAGVAQAGTLSRLAPTTAEGRLLLNVSNAGAYLFQSVEKFNRRITFRAAYDLALQGKLKPSYVADLRRTYGRLMEEVRARGFSEDEALAFVAGRDAVIRTQFEYARWARPEFMRGKKSVVFLFQQYVQNVLWFLRYSPGRGRALMLLLFAAGFMGLPFAEDLKDTIRLLSRNLFGEDYDLELELRKYLVAAGVDDPNILLHGAFSEYGLGLLHLAELAGVAVPHTDISASISLGDIIPGTDALAAPGDFRDRILRAGTDAGGAAFSMGMNLLQAIASDNPDRYKRWERAMPSALRSVSRGVRFLTRGEETTRGGSTIAEFNTTDPVQRAEVIAQLFGFTPSRLSKKWDFLRFAQEKIIYWKIQQTNLLTEFDFARRTKDSLRLREVRRLIREYNREVPDPRLRISSKTIRESLRTRQRRRQRAISGVPVEKKFRRLVGGLEAEAFPTVEEL